MPVTASLESKDRVLRLGLCDNIYPRSIGCPPHPVGRVGFKSLTITARTRAARRQDGALVVKSGNENIYSIDSKTKRGYKPVRHKENTQMANIKDLLKVKPAPKGRLTIRIAGDVRAKAEKIAQSNSMSLAQVVEAGLALLFKQELKQNEKK